MKRNIIISLITVLTFFVSNTAVADSFDNAINSISEMNKVEVTTLSKSMFNSVRMPFSNYNMDAIKHNMTSMTIINSENNLSRIRQIIKTAIQNENYTTMLHQKDEDGEYTKILARSSGAGTYSRMVFIIDEGDEITFVSIDGKFTEQDFTMLSKKRSSQPSKTVTIAHISDIDTVGMSPEMKKQYFEHLKEGAEQYQKGMKQYRRGMEQYKKGMEQYEKNLKTSSQKMEELRKQLKAVGIDLPYKFNDATIIMDADTTDIKYKNPGKSKQHITVDSVGNITVNGKKVISADKKQQKQ